MYDNTIILFVDVNMVAEPKPHQTGRKRQNITKTGNDWWVARFYLQKFISDKMHF